MVYTKTINDSMIINFDYRVPNGSGQGLRLYNTLVTNFSIRIPKEKNSGLCSLLTLNFVGFGNCVSFRFRFPFDCSDTLGH
jgi:hypothetical protein